MEPASFIPLARVMKTHGLKGEVALAPAGDLPFAFPEGLAVWFVPPPAQIRTARLEGVRNGPKGPVAKFSGVDGIDAARLLVGCEVLAREEDIPAGWLDQEDELDIVGYSVVADDRGPLGELTEVIVTGANDVWVVEGRFGQVLLPVIDEVVLDIDDDTETITVHLLPGLLEGGEEA